MATKEKVMRTLWLGLVVLGLVSNATLGLAAESRGEERSDEGAVDEQRRQSEGRAYLGVAVESLHPSLFGHLEELLRGGEGVRIVRVSDGSPADQAGLRSNDIILRYDDQRIFSPQQLAKLVSLDEPGRDVELAIIRAGKSKEVSVTLGEQGDAASPSAHRALRPQLRDRRPKRIPRTGRPDRWESFDSLTLARVDDEHFKATVSYRNKTGKLVTHEFEGTREELIRDVKAEADLPANERNHLLRALGSSGHPLPLELSELRVLPDGRVILDVPEWEEAEVEEPQEESPPRNARPAF